MWYENPDWWQVILIVVGTGVASAAFLSERNAIRLTQRADILLDKVGFAPRRHPYSLTGNTRIAIEFKNFGPTRASNVQTTVNLEIVGADRKQGPEGPPMPTSVVGAGDNLTAGFPELGLAYDDAAIAKASKGDTPLRFDATVEYTDVFGKQHRTRASGVYYGGDGTFQIERNDEAT